MVCVAVGQIRSGCRAAYARREPTVRVFLPIVVSLHPLCDGPTPPEGSSCDWIGGVFAARPDLASFADAWSAHPYGHDPDVPLSQAGNQRFSSTA